MLLLQQGQPYEKAQIFRNPGVFDRKEVFLFFFERLTTLSAALCSR